MKNDIMTDQEFQEWVNRVPDNRTEDEINKEIEEQAGI